MKKHLHILLFLFLVLSLGACHKKPPVIHYDASMLYGKWQEGSVFERYYDSPIERVLPNGDTVYVNGTTWDVSDDVTEDEAQLFNWTLAGANTHRGWHRRGHGHLIGTADQDGEEICPGIHHLRDGVG